MDFRDIEAHGTFFIAFAALSLSVYNAFKDRRRIEARVEWRWETDGKKLLTVFVSNLRPRPVSIRFVILEQESSSGTVTRHRIWREGQREQSGRLRESDYVWADRTLSEWPEVRGIYAIDANRRKWRVPGRQIRSIRDPRPDDPKGKTEIF